MHLSYVNYRLLRDAIVLEYETLPCRDLLSSGVRVRLKSEKKSVYDSGTLLVLLNNWMLLEIAQVPDSRSPSYDITLCVFETRSLT